MFQQLNTGYSFFLQLTEAKTERHCTKLVNQRHAKYCKTLVVMDTGHLACTLMRDPDMTWWTVAATGLLQMGSLRSERSQLWASDLEWDCVWWMHEAVCIVLVNVSSADFISNTTIFTFVESLLSCKVILDSASVWVCSCLEETIFCFLVSYKQWESDCSTRTSRVWKCKHVLS